MNKLTERRINSMKNRLNHLQNQLQNIENAHIGIGDIEELIAEMNKISLEISSKVMDRYSILGATRAENGNENDDWIF